MCATEYVQWFTVNNNTGQSPEYYARDTICNDSYIYIYLFMLVGWPKNKM